MKYFVHQSRLRVIKSERENNPLSWRWDLWEHKWVEEWMEPGSSSWFAFDEITKEEAQFWIEKNEIRVGTRKPTE